MKDKHKIRMQIGVGYSAPTWMVLCPYDRADPSRPCWPVNEYGEKEPPPMSHEQVCTVDTWIDNLELEEWFVGEVIEVDFEVEQVEWSNGADSGPSISFSGEFHAPGG